MCVNDWLPAFCAYNASPKAAQIRISDARLTTGVFFQSPRVLRIDVAGDVGCDMPDMARSDHGARCMAAHSGYAFLPGVSSPAHLDA